MDIKSINLLAKQIGNFIEGSDASGVDDECQFTGMQLKTFVKEIEHHLTANHKPIIVDGDSDATEMNIKHGESYGVDWVYAQAEYSDSEELEMERIQGKNAATFLVEHMLRMQAAKVEVPVEINGRAYLVSVRNKSMECDETAQMKDCPFCNCSWEEPQAEQHADSGRWTVGCMNPRCGASTGFCDTEDEAIRLWNNRA